MKIPNENLNAMIQFLTDISDTSGDHFMIAAAMLRTQRANIKELETKVTIGRRAMRMLRKHNRYLGESIGESVTEWCIECDNSGSCSDNCELASTLQDAEQAGMGVES